MPYFYERNIVEIKNEYTTFLTNIMVTPLYDGLKSMYDYAIEQHRLFLEKSRSNPGIKSPGVLKIFQTILKEVPSLNNHKIESETNRIRSSSNCANWFDDLVKATIKANLVLLTFNSSKEQSPLVNSRYHETIKTKDFVHKCYVEAARKLYNNPELFWHEYPALELKRNQRDIMVVLEESIKEAVRQLLPMTEILSEYLSNDYVPEDSTIRIPEEKYMAIRDMLQRDLGGMSMRTNQSFAGASHSAIPSGGMGYDSPMEEVRSHRQHGFDEMGDDDDDDDDLKKNINALKSQLEGGIVMGDDELDEPIESVNEKAPIIDHPSGGEHKESPIDSPVPSDPFAHKIGGKKNKQRAEFLQNELQAYGNSKPEGDREEFFQKYI